MPETFAVWIRRPGFLPSERLGTVVLQCHAHRPGSNTADTNVEQLSQLFPGPCFRRHSASQPVKSQNERLRTVVLQCHAHHSGSNSADAKVEQLSQLFPSPSGRRHSASQPTKSQRNDWGQSFYIAVLTDPVRTPQTPMSNNCLNCSPAPAAGATQRVNQRSRK